MIKVHNSLTRKLEPLKAQKGKGKKLTMYVCGPTVYGPSHLGHARTYVAFDIIRRYLEFRNYKVKLAINITDIHDDIIKEAKEQNTDVKTLARKYEKMFFEDMESLHIKPANVWPRVTEHIKDIEKFIDKLLKLGYAYKTSDGIYYDISKFKDYGKLSRIKLSKQITGTRVRTDKYEKEEARDFALWKLSNEKPYWKSKFGNGRPGWHIECSVMSIKHLGYPIDIHCGAKDLIFPHHENEIAQSEAYMQKKPFVRYWLHTGYLTINGQKMSKSLKNYITVREMLEKYDARAFRLMIAKTHYSSAFDFSERKIKQEMETLKRLENFFERLHNDVKLAKTNEKQILKEFSKAKKDFIRHMDNNFSTPKAFETLFRLISKTNAAIDKDKISKKTAKKIFQYFVEIDKIFDVFWPKKAISKKVKKLPKEIMELIKKREKLRQEKRYKEADKIREMLKKKGIILIDTPEGTKWKLE